MTPQELQWLQQSGISFNENENGASQPGNFTTNYGPLWDAANPMYGGFSMDQGQTPESYMERLYRASRDPSYGTQGLSYGDLSSGTGFFNNAARDGKYARIGDNLAQIQNNQQMMQIINANGGLAAMTRNDPTYGMEFDTTNPAYQQLSQMQSMKNNSSPMDSAMTYLAIMAAAAGGAGMLAGAGGAGGSAAVGEGVGATAGAAGGAVNPIWGEMGAYGAGGAAPAGFDAAAAGGIGTDAASWGVNAREAAGGFGSSGLTEGDILASESGFTPGSFELGASGYGGTAAAGLTAAGAEAGVGGGLAGQAAKTAGGSMLSRLFSGDASGGDYASLIGGAGSSLLGYMGAQDQMKGYQAMQDKSMAMGAPYREKLLASYQPGFDMSSDPAYQGAMDQSSKAVLRGLSASGGNPWDSPGALMEANKYVTEKTALPQLNAYRSQLGTFGQFGVNQAGTQGTAAVQAGGGQYDAMGAGLQAMTKQNTSLTDLAAKYGLNMGASL